MWGGARRSRVKPGIRPHVGPAHSEPDPGSFAPAESRVRQIDQGPVPKVSFGGGFGARDPSPVSAASCLIRPVKDGFFRFPVRAVWRCWLLHAAAAWIPSRPHVCGRLLGSEPGQGAPCQAQLLVLVQGRCLFRPEVLSDLCLGLLEFFVLICWRLGRSSPTRANNHSRVGWPAFMKPGVPVARAGDGPEFRRFRGVTGPPAILPRQGVKSVEGDFRSAEQVRRNRAAIILPERVTARRFVGLDRPSACSPPVGLRDHALTGLGLS